MIIVKNHNRLEGETSVITGMSGRFILEKLKVDARGVPIEASRIRVAEFDNLILNAGLNRIGTNGDWLSAVQVGSGTTPPAVTDTGMQSFIAGTTTIQATSVAAQPSPPYYTTRSVTQRFAAGAAAGNISEVGIGWAATGSTLFSRALVVDGGGVPTTITVLSDEVLDVTYQLRNYPPASDVTGSITITGVGTVGTTIRAAEVTNANSWGLGQSGAIGGFSTRSGEHDAYSGAIGAVTGVPSGTSGAGSAVNAAYSSGSFKRDATITWPLNNANFGGINSVRLELEAIGSSGTFGAIQIGFGTTIAKNATNTFTLNASHVWARRTL
jgi:hypothetical protein